MEWIWEKEEWERVRERRSKKKVEHVEKRGISAKAALRYAFLNQQRNSVDKTVMLKVRRLFKAQSKWVLSLWVVYQLLSPKRVGIISRYSFFFFYNFIIFWNIYTFCNAIQFLRYLKKFRLLFLFFYRILNLDWKNLNFLVEKLKLSLLSFGKSNLLD